MTLTNRFQEPPGLEDLANRMSQGFRLVRNEDISGEDPRPTVLADPPKPGFLSRIKKPLLFPWRILRQRLECMVASETAPLKQEAEAARKRISELEFRLGKLEIRIDSPDPEMGNRHRHER